MGLFRTGAQAANNVKGSGQAIGDAFNNFSVKNMFSGADLHVAPPGKIERGLSFMGRNLVAKPLGAGLKVVDWSLGVLAKPVAWLAAAPGAAFRAFPNASVIATVAIPVIAAGTWFARRKSRALEQNFADAQTQAMATQTQGMYTNSASQADVDARIAADVASGVAPAGQAAAVSARQQVAAPEVARA